MNLIEQAQADTSLIRAKIADRERAVREKDVAGLLKHYADDVISFDVLPPLAHRGVQAVRKRVTDWFASFETPIDYECRALDLAVSGDVAFDLHFTHVRGINRAGMTIDMWFRETVCYRRLAGEWKVTHQHSSVPFDMKQGVPLALLDLEP